MSTSSCPLGRLPLGKLTITAVILALLPARAFAQDPPSPEGGTKKLTKPALPLDKASPFLNRKQLAIPGKLPPIQPAQVPPTTTRPQQPPPPPAPPPAAGDENGRPVIGMGDLKQTADKRCKPLKDNEKVLFEFKGADIQDVVSAISKSMCKNFIITSKVRSQKFDIISPTPITVGEAWRAFLSALEANDFALFQVGRYYKIIQATDTTRAPVDFLDREDKVPNTDNVVTKIWKLQHPGDVNAIVNYLNIFKSGKGQIHPFHATNTIVVTDFGTSINRLERILSEIDQPGVLERVHIVSVEFATASEIAEKLTQIFEPAKAGAPKPPGAARTFKAGEDVSKPGAPGGQSGAAEAAGDDDLSVSKILADDRTNKLIIIASEGSFRQIMSLKKQLDVPAQAGEGQIHVVRLKHANADELASTLSALATGKPTTPKKGKATGKAPAVPIPAQPGGATSASLLEGEVKITAEKATNALLITATKADFVSLKRVIDQLDVPRYQVFVEAVIMEVNIKRDRTLGLSWHGGIAPVIDGKETPIVFGNAHSDLKSLQLTSNPLALASLLGFAGAVRGPPLAGTETLVQGGIPSIGVVIQALQSTNDVNVISTPHLLTMDNEEAEIQVNEKRPFSSGINLGGLGALGSLGSLAGQAGGAGALSNLAGLGLGSLSFTREDVGLTLKLKPQINDQEYVRLELDQELSDVAGVDQVTGQTITSKRAAKTTVVVRDQDSVVIGGLVRDRESTDESKTPFLGDIPLLGWLFKRQKRINEKVNLLLVLTPYIIRGPEDFRKVYERKMEERKEFVQRFYGDTPEYRAKIDWERKRGPLARYLEEIRLEMQKAENEGPGAPDETVIKSDVELPASKDAPLQPNQSSPGIPAPIPSPNLQPPPSTPPIESPESAPPPPPLPPDDL